MVYLIVYIGSWNDTYVDIIKANNGVRAWNKFCRKHYKENYRLKKIINLTKDEVLDIADYI